MKCDKCGHNMPVDPYRTVDVKAKSLKRKVMKIPWKSIWEIPWKNIGFASVFVSIAICLFMLISAIGSAPDSPTYCYTDSNRFGVTWLKGNVEWGEDVNIANNDPKHYLQFCEKDDKVYDCYKRICSDLNLEFHQPK